MVTTNSDTYISRWSQVRGRLAEVGLEGLVLTGGADMLHLTGYQAMPLERITAVVFSPDEGGKPSHPLLVVPELERPRVSERQEVFDVKGWDDATNPIQLIADSLPNAQKVAVSDDMWAAHLLELQELLGAGRNQGHPELVSISQALGGLRSVKSPEEQKAMQTVGALADQVAAQLQAGQIPLVGRTERQVAADIGQRLLAVGHETVEFVIVASGPNSASPHHHPGERIIEKNEMVLCDFGGKHHGYCSDTTRCVFTGPIPDDVASAYQTLQQAQAAGVATAKVGNQLADVDQAARTVIADAGYGDFFVHRTGHGIGIEVHEQPYVTATNTKPIVAGHVFSVEPGIYLPDQWGMRLEDIVAVTEAGPQRCNTSNHELVVVQ